MIVLGIDPGLATIGYGIIEANRGVYKDIDYGVILTPKEKSIPERLKMIYDGICLLIDEFKPDEIGIEKLFLQRMLRRHLMYRKLGE